MPTNGFTSDQSLSDAGACREQPHQIMNHKANIYTALFFAIILTAISIWGDDIRESEGKNLAFIIFVGVFAFKMAVDDYIHFQTPSSHEFASLSFSLLMYLLLSASLAYAATSHVVNKAGNLAVAEWLFVGVMAVGTTWLWVSIAGNDPDPKKLQRRVFWTAVNILIGGTLILHVCTPYWEPYSTKIFYALTGAVVVDALFIGRTFQRLAETK